MRQSALLVALSAFLCACATETEAPWNPLAGFEQVDTITILDAPEPQAGTYAPEMRGVVERGRYLVEVLACGSCHTPGALDGEPDLDRALAGSLTGIAYTSPLGTARPGIVYPSNITPDEKTGIGLWSDQQIANAIRSGVGQHGSQPIAMMPWQGYARLRDDDTDAIVSYLRSIEPVNQNVPNKVVPGRNARHAFVYFGVYRSRDQ